MRRREQWREVTLRELWRLVLRGWEWLAHPGGHGYALRSPRGAVYDFCCGNGTAALRRKAVRDE